MIKTTAELRKLANASGSFFFKPKTMAFFNSRVERTVYANRYFITSEQFGDEAPREWAVREFAAEQGEPVDINTVSRHATLEAALAAIASL